MLPQCHYQLYSWKKECPVKTTHLLIKPEPTASAPCSVVTLLDDSAEFSLSFNSFPIKQGIAMSAHFYILGFNHKAPVRALLPFFPEVLKLPVVDWEVSFLQEFGEV